MTTTDLRDGWKRRGIEWAMLPATAEDFFALRVDVKRLGTTDQITNGLIGWIAARASGQDTSGTSPRTAATYRKILVEVAKRRKRRVGANAHNPRGVEVMSGGRGFDREPELVSA